MRKYIPRPIKNALRNIAHGIRARSFRRSTQLDCLFDIDGVLLNPERLNLNSRLGVTAARLNSYFHIRDKAQIALHVAQMYPGGDYFEFGSMGAATFRSFLSAFKLCGMDESFENTRFRAFDYFGDLSTMDTREELKFDEQQRSYFDIWAGFVDGKQQSQHTEAGFREMVERHGLFCDRVDVYSGFFEDIFSQEFRDELVRDGIAIGFAFVDCNLAKSYKSVFDFIGDFLFVGSFVYLDENYLVGDGYDNRPYFLDFRKRMREDRGIDVDFVTAAGTYGALYKCRTYYADP